MTTSNFQRWWPSWQKINDQAFKHQYKVWNDINPKLISDDKRHKILHCHVRIVKLKRVHKKQKKKMSWDTFFGPLFPKKGIHLIEI